MRARFLLIPAALLLAAASPGDLVSNAIIPVPSHPHGVAIAGFLGDGCPHIAAGACDPPGIVLIRGRRSGNFDPPSSSRTMM